MYPPHGGEVSPAGSVGVGKAPLALNASPAPPPTRRMSLSCREFRERETRPSKLHKVQLDSFAHPPRTRLTRACCLTLSSLEAGLASLREGGAAEGGGGRNFFPKDSHPLPPPAPMLFERGDCAGAGGGDYSIYLISKGACPLCIPYGGEPSPEPPPTRRGFGLGCRLGRSWTVPTGHQDPPCIPPRGGK